MVSAIPRTILMRSAKRKGSYPIHFLKSRGSAIKNNFLNTELNKSTFLHHEMFFFIHYSLQIKQNIYSIGIVCAPVVTQFIVKV